MTSNKCRLTVSELGSTRLDKGIYIMTAVAGDRCNRRQRDQRIQGFNSTSGNDSFFSVVALESVGLSLVCVMNRAAGCSQINECSSNLLAYTITNLLAYTVMSQFTQLDHTFFDNYKYG